MIAPFQYFGGKRTVAAAVWQRFGRPKQFIEPFCGSAAVLLAAPAAASLEVVGDTSGFIANFWRATVAQPGAVAQWADYPVSHIDLGARHQWLMDQRGALADGLRDANWPGDAKVAGWWLWGQCAWIGSGWCEWSGKVPHVSDAGRDPAMWTSGGETARRWLRQLAARMERVRVVHGDWTRCLNHHFGGAQTAVFLDPPYKAYEALYGSTPIAADVEQWARENADLRIAICGHAGDYDLPRWEAARWNRGSLTYGGATTTADECVWYSPACLPVGLFAEAVS